MADILDKATEPDQKMIVPLSIIHHFHQAANHFEEKWRPEVYLPNMSDALRYRNLEAKMYEAYLADRHSTRR